MKKLYILLSFVQQENFLKHYNRIFKIYKSRIEKDESYEDAIQDWALEVMANKIGIEEDGLKKNMDKKAILQYSKSICYRKKKLIERAMKDRELRERLEEKQKEIEMQYEIHQEMEEDMERIGDLIKEFKVKLSEQEEVFWNFFKAYTPVEDIATNMGITKHYAMVIKTKLANKIRKKLDV